MTGHKKTMHMKNGQRMKQYIRIAELPYLNQSKGVIAEIIMGQHDSFRATRGARRVQQCRRRTTL